MINIISSNKIAKEIVQKSILRSHGNIENKLDNIYCFISPDSNAEKLIEKIVLKKSKVLIFGSISESLAKLIGLEYNNNSLILDDIKYDHNKNEDKSNLFIKYNQHTLNKNNPLENRYFYRFDFTDEWNNLGYGKITTNNDIWSVSNSLEAINAEIIADIYENNNKKSVFVSLKDFKNSSVLYINREVGLVDGLDVSIVEFFLSNYKIDELPTLPLILDLPNGYNITATPRLDCDQSIINTKPLFELYKSYEINTSLAISTGINISEIEIDYLNNFYNNGGALLSHTINHYFDWGDCYDIVFDEAEGSKKWLEEHVQNLDILEYAVSPFHTNKYYSIEALADVGYKGFISGIIHNDPEYLLGTSGQVPFTKQNIVSHSQQCMLHGDCYHRNKDSIDIYKESFKMHYKAKKNFGYLDHPFGDYDYGWKSEEERLNVHKEFIEFINSFDNVKWITSVDMLKFIYDKSKLIIDIDINNILHLNRQSNESSLEILVEYNGKTYVC